MSYVQDDINTIDHNVLYTPELLGQECFTCYRILRYQFFQRDTSYRCGYKPQCIDCSVQPRLSMEEHVSRLKIGNFNSEATKAQRHEDQEEWRKIEARRGKQLHCSDVLVRLLRLVPTLYVKEGGIVGDLGLYNIAPGPRADWGGKNYKYMGYISHTLLPEYSIYEFDEERDVMIRANEQGWRDVLLRFIRGGLLTEEQCDKEFGRPTGQGSTVWFKKLWNFRHLKQDPQTP